MSFTIPAAGQDEPEAAVPDAWQEPEISVPVSVIGDAAELMTLVAELIDASRDGVIRSGSRRCWTRRAPSPARPPTG